MAISIKTSDKYDEAIFMIDKVLMNTGTVFLVFFIILVSGCGIDPPLKQTNSNQTIVMVPPSESSEEPLPCSNSVNSAPKKVAILHIGVEHPAESRLFPQLQDLFTKRLLQRAQIESIQHFHDATRITLKPHQVSLLGTVNRDMKSQIREIGRQSNSQIIVKGTISKISVSLNDNPIEDSESDTPNDISETIEQISKQLSDISWRKISIKLQIFDSHSGNILRETETEQKISLKSSEPFFFITTIADQEEYEARMEERMIAGIDSLIKKQIEIVDEVALCTPLMGHVISADNLMATIDVGARSQLDVGDQFEIIQTRLVHTDARGIEHMLEERVGMLRITEVQSDSATGQFENLSRATEIQRGDLVVAY